MSNSSKSYMDSFKGMLGLSAGAGASNPPPSTSNVASLPTQATEPIGQRTPPRAIKAPHPEVIPEVVSTPSDFGIYGISHEIRQGQGSIWKRLFQDPREANNNMSSNDVGGRQNSPFHNSPMSGSPPSASASASGGGPTAASS